VKRVTRTAFPTSQRPTVNRINTPTLIPVPKGVTARPTANTLAIWSWRTPAAAVLPLNFYTSLSISTDGNILLAGASIYGASLPAASRGGLLLSTNAGTSWSRVTAGTPQADWSFVSISGTGRFMFATSLPTVNEALPTFPVSLNGAIWRSTDTGVTWSSITPRLTASTNPLAPAMRWNDVACSLSGAVIAAALDGTTALNPTLVLSTNFGASWIANPQSGLTLNLVQAGRASNYSGLAVGTRGNGEFIVYAATENNGIFVTQITALVTSAATPGGGSTALPTLTRVGGQTVQALKWQSIACSNTGDVVAAVFANSLVTSVTPLGVSGIMVSTNSGAT
jgi:hypothetical protein